MSRNIQYLAMNAWPWSQHWWGPILSGSSYTTGTKHTQDWDSTNIGMFNYCSGLLFSSSVSDLHRALIPLCIKPLPQLCKTSISTGNDIKHDMQ